MQVKAILFVTNSSQLENAPLRSATAFVEVLGRSLLGHWIEQLRRHSVSEITVIAESDHEALHGLEGVEVICAGEGVNLWRAGELTFIRMSDPDTDGILLARAEQYAEIDWSELVRHHLYFNNRMTRVIHGGTQQPLDIYAIDPGRRNDAAYSMRSGLRETRTQGVRYATRDNEYFNPLRDGRDLRRLAADALYGRCQLRPEGREARPGVWLGEGARIEKGARLVAPVYVGRRTRVRLGAVITRGSSLEHHCTADCGTIVDDTSVMPYTAIGPGLDVSGAVVGEGRLLHLKRNVCIELNDPRLVREQPARLPVRLFKGTARLLSYLPQQVWRGAKMNGAREPAIGSGACVKDFNTAFGKGVKGKPELPHLTPDLAVMRRYGNQ